MTSKISKYENLRCVLGIKFNRLTFEIKTLNADEDQSSYEYICNTSCRCYDNGNGCFAITMVNSKLEIGIPIANWIIKSGEIRFDWGSSDTYFTMVDDKGIETRNIFSMGGKGTASGFNIESLTRSIFSKAIQIVAEYPSAEVYNAYMDFYKKRPKSREIERLKKSYSETSLISDFKLDIFEPLQICFKSFERLELLLDSSSDNRSKLLLAKATKEFNDSLKLIIG